MQLVFGVGIALGVLDGSTQGLAEHKELKSIRNANGMRFGVRRCRALKRPS